MTFHLIDDGTDRQRWLQARAASPTIVSATDAARIMTGGAGTWASLRKEKETGQGFGGNAYTRHGNEREATIAAYARDTFGLIPSTALIARHDGTTGSEDYATPDALSQPHVTGFGIPELGGMQTGTEYHAAEFGEFKTTVRDWPNWEDVPRKYHWQVVWQFHVTGADRCRFVFEAHENFVPLHMEPRVFTIERADVLDEIDEAVAEVAVWRAAETEPLPEGLVPLDGLMSQHARAKEIADAASARAADLAERIRALSAEQADGRKFTFEGSDANLTLSAPGTRAAFDGKAFAARYPAAARRFTKTTETQPRLTITARS